MVEGGGSIILEHYQARVSDGEWHHVQLSVVRDRAVLLLDNRTQSARLHTPIRTGEAQVSSGGSEKEIRQKILIL